MKKEYFSPEFFEMHFKLQDVICTTKQVLDEHLLFQRRICRKMCSLIQKQNAVSV